MKVISYSEFRGHLTGNLNIVNEDKEIVIVSRTKGKNVVVMDLDEYNAVQETLHLTSSETNRHRLEEAIRELNKGGGKIQRLIEK